MIWSKYQLKCTNCGYEVTRQLKTTNGVGMVMRCPQCKNPMHIEQNIKQRIRVE